MIEARKGLSGVQTEVEKHHRNHPFPHQEEKEDAQSDQRRRTRSPNAVEERDIRGITVRWTIH